MITVSLQCRECSTGFEIGSQFEPNEATAIEDTQQHMNTHYLARCGSCFACDWEVTKVRW